MEKKYAIKRKDGLWFRDFYWDRGMTKAGTPRKSGPATRRADFGADPCLMNKSLFDYYVITAVKNNIADFFEDTEIIAFEYQPTVTTLRMKTVRNRVEAKEIMRKLKEV